MERMRKHQYSMFQKEMTKEAVNELPIQRYEGKIVIVANEAQMKEALEEIAQSSVVGFDTETKPAFKKGEYNSVSLLQIATEKIVYLFRLNLIGFPTELATIFENPSIIKTGISIRDDIKEMAKIRDFNPQNIVELNTVAKELEIRHAGVRRLAAIFLGVRISKAQQTTNWEREVLTPQQLVYAATDAWVCLEIYKKLEDLGYI